MAVCDKELSGKTLDEKGVGFKVSEYFYGTEAIEEKKLIELFKEFENINIVGKKSVGILLREGLITPKNIIKIGGIPHIQIFCI